MLKRDLVRSENGVVCPDEHQLSREQAVKDDFRINYLSSYGDQIALKIQKGVPVKSYLMWAWTDNFECRSPSAPPLLPLYRRLTSAGQEGFTARFGVVWIDYNDGCKRYPKASAGYMKRYFEDRMAAKY